jgi:cysteine desulfurase
MARKTIYLDSAATTRVDNAVVKEMEKYWLKEYGNASSVHEMGERALRAVGDTRGKMARAIGGRAEELIFTSGATESNNLAFFGLARSELGKKRKKIVISKIEHSSVFSICDALKREGFEICEIGVDRAGLIDIEGLEREIDSKTLLVSIIHVSNEIGVVQDIGKIGEICKKRGVIFHSDCAQSFGKLKIDVKAMGIDLLSAGAHKIHGPKGIGFLFIREGIKIEPIIYGGGQERGLRGGTENVPCIAGFGKALDRILKVDKEKIGKIRDYFIEGLERLGGKINGSKEKRIYNNISVRFPGADGESLVLALSDKMIMCSTGSACDSRKKEESRVLKSIGLNEKEMGGSLRFSLDSGIGKKEIDFVLRELGRILC